jgi:hypothetical protein
MENGTESHATAAVGIEITRADGTKEAPAGEATPAELAKQAGLELVVVGHRVLDVGHALLNGLARRLGAK